MSCPMEENIEKGRMEKLTKYQNITYEMRENRRGF